MSSNTPEIDTRDEYRELSDADLEGVAAGKDWSPVGVGITPRGRVGVIGSPFGYGGYGGWGGWGRGYGGWW
jgi:hypothetical protein